MKNDHRKHAALWLAFGCVLATTSLYLADAWVAAFIIVLSTTLGYSFAMSNIHRILVMRSIVFGLVATAFLVVITVLTVHGLGRTLFNLPTMTVPRALGGFSVGGSVESSAISQAVQQGIILWSSIASFAMVSATVSSGDFLLLAPRHLYVPALVIAIALSFFPSILSASRDAKLANLSRSGRKSRGFRGIRSRIVSVLDTALERSNLLAESMESRAFGARRSSGLALAGLTFLLVSAVSFVSGFSGWSGSESIKNSALVLGFVFLLIGLLLLATDSNKQEVSA